MGRKKALVYTAFFVVLGVVIAGTITPVPGNPADAQEQAPPNILYIVVDDADEEAMNRYMPQTQARVKNRGANFTSFYVAQPLCCPSRASVLLGEYVHNHDVEASGQDPNRWARFRALGHERRTINLAMKSAGYSTGLFGKYLNGYHSTSHVPPGWDEWLSKWGQNFYGWKATTETGRVNQWGSRPDDWADRVALQKTQDFASATTAPFFAYVAPTAPHRPLTSPPDNQGLNRSFRKGPAWDEGDVSDKPSFVRNNPRLSEANKRRIKDDHVARAKMLEYADIRIATTLDALQNAGELENTYVVVTSDNGWLEGEHRIANGKAVPYEEAANMPLWMSGPGIPAGSTIETPTSNVDLYATFTDMAGEVTDSRDGVSLLPLATGGSISRNGVLVEGQPGPQNYDAVVTIEDGTLYKYVSYKNGEEELYDLSTDPYETESLHKSADPPLLATLKARLDALAACEGTTCAEG